MFLLARFFDVANTASVSFVLETNGKEVQFEFYDLVRDGINKSPGVT